MPKLTILSITGFSIIIAILFGTILFTNHDRELTSFGQKTSLSLNVGNINSTSTKFTDLFSTKKYEFCFDDAPDSCTQTIIVLYESPTTIALTSGFRDILWQAVDLIKKDGYTIDGFTSYPAQGVLSSPDYQNIYTTIVMSKQ